MPMATKPGKVATFNDKLPCIKSEDPLTSGLATSHVKIVKTTVLQSKPLVAASIITSK